MSISRWHNSSLDELLNKLIDARARSPIIDELCQRLEGEELKTPHSTNHTCPICEAELWIDVDQEAGVTYLKKGHN